MKKMNTTGVISVPETLQDVGVNNITVTYQSFDDVSKTITSDVSITYMEHVGDVSISYT